MKVATEEPPLIEEKVSLKQIDEALQKAKVTYEVVVVGVVLGLSATPLVTVYPREEVTKEGTSTDPSQSKDSAPTMTSNSGTTTIEEERPPMIDVIESPISLEFERTPSQEGEKEEWEEYFEKVEEELGEEETGFDPRNLYGEEEDNEGFTKKEQKEIIESAQRLVVE